jgi:hypothetical protein
VDKQLVRLVVEGEVEVGHLVQGEVLETTATRYDDIAHFGAGDKGAVVLVRGNAA